MNELRVKILVIGQSSVGKSSLLLQYVNGTFSMGHTPTIGVDYKQKTIQIPNQETVRVQLWDTAGTERYRTLTPIYYRNVDGVLLVYDITDEKSFQRVDYWVDQLNVNTDVANIDMMVVGNKSDLAEKRMVEEKAGREMAKKMGQEYCETSATDFELTSSAFDRLIRKILKKKKRDISDSVELSPPVQKSSKKRFDCC